jgi:hypothetical protein
MSLFFAYFISFYASRESLVAVATRFRQQRLNSEYIRATFLFL